MNRERELQFILVDIDYYLSEKEERPVIRLYGKTKDKQIRVTIQDFLPYFYVKKNAEVTFILKNDPFLKEWVVSTEEVTMRRYFWGAEKVKLVKVCGKNPEKIPILKQTVEKLGLETFETDIPFLKRFLLDTAIKCLNVVNVNCYSLEKKEERIFAEASYREIFPLSELEEHSPSFFYSLKVMAFSLKVAQEQKTAQAFLEENNRRIIAITAISGVDGKPDGGKLFLLQEDSDDGEKELIMDFIKHLQKMQPDILCTYRGDSFDLPFLFRRMKILRLPTHLFSLFSDEAVFYSKRLLSYRIKGRMVFDLALRTWGIHPKSGKKGLYDVAEAVLGITGYEEIEPLQLLWYSGMFEGCEDDLRLFAKLCFQDCKIIYELFWKLGMSGWIETLRVTGFPPSEGNNCTERINGEFELMRFMRRKGILIPHKPNEKEVEKNAKERENFPHEGGTVLFPQGLLHTGVLIFDFRSMYPSVMIAHNIGGETLKNWVSADEHGNALKLFHEETRSALSIMEKELVERRIAKKEKIEQLTKQLSATTISSKRKELKHLISTLEREQTSMKIVANAMYGAHYYVRSRFYSQPLAGAIADAARMYLLNIKNYLSEISEKIIPCELVYGDTDSAFIKLLDNRLIVEAYNECEPIKKKALISLLRDNIVASILKELNGKLPKPIELTLKDIAYRCVFKPERKKAYAYLSLLSEEMEIKGFEAVRSDWSPISQAAQKKVLEIFLTQREEERKEEIVRGKVKRREHTEPEFNKAEKFLLEFGRRIVISPTRELLPYVITYSPIKRHPNQYRVLPPGVFAFLDFCAQEGLNPESEWFLYDKFPWVIVPGGGAIFKRARHPKYASDIDRTFYIRQMLLGIRTFGLETSLEDVLKTKNEALNEVISLQAEKKDLNFTEGGILPYSNKDLTWMSSYKGKKRKEQRVVAGQSQLSVFLERGDEE